MNGCGCATRYGYRYTLCGSKNNSTDRRQVKRAAQPIDDRRLRGSGVHATLEPRERIQIKILIIKGVVKENGS